MLVFCFISISKFGSFKNPFATFISLTKLLFRCRRFILLVQQKKWFLSTMAASQAVENHGDEWGFSWYLEWGIYTSIPIWNHQQSSVTAAEVTISTQIIMKTIQISTRIVMSGEIKGGIPFWVWREVKWNWDKIIIRIPNGEKVIVEQTPASEEINKSKRAALWDS